MSRYYETDEELEANKEGHRDVQHNRRNYEHDRYSDEPEDIAYWQGRHDEERKQRIEEEERQMEADREQREFERQKQAEANQRERDEEDSDQQTVGDFDALMEREQRDMESQDDERPSNEEDLFRDILRDEREDND